MIIKGLGKLPYRGRLKELELFGPGEEKALKRAYCGLSVLKGEETLKKDEEKLLVRVRITV